MKIETEGNIYVINDLVKFSLEHNNSLINIEYNQKYISENEAKDLVKKFIKDIGVFYLSNKKEDKKGDK